MGSGIALARRLTAVAGLLLASHLFAAPIVVTPGTSAGYLYFSPASASGLNKSGAAAGEIACDATRAFTGGSITITSNTTWNVPNAGSTGIPASSTSRVCIKVEAVGGSGADGYYPAVGGGSGGPGVRKIGYFLLPQGSNLSFVIGQPASAPSVNGVSNGGSGLHGGGGAAPAQR